MNPRVWLVDLRKSKGMNQKELASKAGISQNYLSNIEKGFRNPSGRVALRLSSVLGFDMNLFYQDHANAS